MHTKCSKIPKSRVDRLRMFDKQFGGTGLNYLAAGTGRLLRSFYTCIVCVGVCSFIFVGWYGIIG